MFFKAKKREISESPIDYNKRIPVKFSCGGTQRKRLITLGELSYVTLSNSIKGFLEEKDNREFKIYKDKDFLVEFKETDFIDKKPYYGKALKVYIKMFEKSEIIEFDDGYDEKKFPQRPKFEKYGEEKLNEEEEKLIGIFDFLMKQDLVKKFIKKKAEQLEEEDPHQAMPDDQKKDIMITVLANIFQNSKNK